MWFALYKRFVAAALAASSYFGKVWFGRRKRFRTTFKHPLVKMFFSLIGCDVRSNADGSMWIELRKRDAVKRYKKLHPQLTGVKNVKR